MLSLHAFTVHQSSHQKSQTVPQLLSPLTQLSLLRQIVAFTGLLKSIPSLPLPLPTVRQALLIPYLACSNNLFMDYVLQSLQYGKNFSLPAQVSKHATFLNTNCIICKMKSKVYRLSQNDSVSDFHLKSNLLKFFPNYASARNSPPSSLFETLNSSGLLHILCPSTMGLFLLSLSCKKFSAPFEVSI